MYEVRDVCFACTTPYQVLGAISIAKNINSKADLYIFGMFSDYADLAERIRQLDIFDHVFAVDGSEFSFLGKVSSTLEAQFGALKQMFFSEKYVGTFLQKDVLYKQYCSSSRAHVKNLFLHVLQKRNPNTHITIYDDGLGSYLKQSHVLRTSKKRAIIETLFGWNLYDPDKIDIQLYLPEIASLPDELNRCQIRQMPRLDWNEPYNKKLLKAVFTTGSTETIQERVILFDNVRGDIQRKRLFAGIDECYKEILTTLGKDNVILKPHPRSVETPDLDLKIITEAGIPMEAFYADMADLENKILISYNSTATYTPKILFGAEPWVINLHRIIPSSFQEQSESLYSTFKKTYRNKDKLLAPRTMEELRSMLNNIPEGESNGLV